SDPLPDHCSLDADTGVLTWTPTQEQTGAYALPVTATDDGDPRMAADTDVLVKVSPADACVAADCDPATGCVSTPLPIDQSCCIEEPQVRVAEPEAGCPQGRVLFFGRNTVGFGRIQSCDLLRLEFFPQGGTNLRFHIETRCMRSDAPVDIDVRLQTSSQVLLDTSLTVTLQDREDGYAQRLALFFGLPPSISIVELDGREADLSVTLVDADGEQISNTTRVVLTRESLGDLPNPDVEDLPADEAGCVGCHRPVTASGERIGIEEAHPGADLGCTDCHGGNGSASTRADAHVSPGAGRTFIKNLASDQLDAVDPDYLRFVNPGDLRVAATSCGPIGCHPEHVANAPLSTMATYGGHYTLPRYLAGAQARAAEVAAVDVSDPDFDGATAPDGAVPGLTALREPAMSADRATIETAIDIYLPKSCPTCHLNAFGRNAAPGTYRSSGCTACHMVYDDDGLSRSSDPVISKSFPPHPARHRLTTEIPTEQCGHCHFQGGRIGLAYRGIREGGFAPGKTPANGVTLGEPLYGHDSGFYFSDEDSTNAVDETPPDLHHEAGMACADCHVGGDVHGDGALYSAERYQVGVSCESCHGTVRAEIIEDPSDGAFKNDRGFPFRRMRRTTDDRILLTLLMDGREIEVPQIKRIIDAGTNPLMTAAMGVGANDFSHTDSLECYTCHTAWRQNCFGCHVTVDDRGLARNETTGLTTRGASSAIRDDYSLDFFALGINRDGKLSPLCSSMSIFMTYVDENGVARFSDRVRTSGDGLRGFGWNPFHHHTVSRIPQNCDRCHPALPATGIDNTEMLLETYGFGTGAVLAADGDGTIHDLTRFLDEEGNLISDFPHPGTGPVPAEVRERALAVEVVPQPR
ncbi:MAG: multiheme c-type cytochrome, partial [Candidatus Binatia bacterium]